MRMTRTEDSKIILDNGRGETLEWDMSIYDRTRYSSAVDTLVEINAYWAYISEGNREEIWKIYKSVHAAMREVTEPRRLTRVLIELIGTMYQFMPFNDIEHWVKFYGKVQYPEDLKDQYAEGDIIERTYLRQDYIGLVVLAIALRPMVPIWGEFLAMTKDISGSNWKELEALKLLRQTYLLDCEPIHRLKRYVQSSIEKEGDNQTAIIHGMGSEETPDWMLALVVVRRIAPGEVEADATRGNIITNVHAFVGGTLRDLDRKFGGQGVKEKYNRTNKDDDDSTSNVESYKVKQKVSIGDVSLYSVYMEDYQQAARAIDPTIDPALVELCVAVSTQLTNMEIRTHHVTLTQYVMNPVISARGILTLHRTTLLVAMGVTQAILWHWGMRELATLVTAEPSSVDNNMSLAMESRSRIPSEMLKTLAINYPYTENPGRSKTPAKGINYAVKAIQLLSKELSASNWLYRGPKDFRQGVNFIDNSGKIASFHNSMELLARLIIRISGEVNENQ